MLSSLNMMLYDSIIVNLRVILFPLKLRPILHFNVSTGFTWPALQGSCEDAVHLLLWTLSSSSQMQSWIQLWYEKGLEKNYSLPLEILIVFVSILFIACSLVLLHSVWLLSVPPRCSESLWTALALKKLLCLHTHIWVMETVKSYSFSFLLLWRRNITGSFTL